MSLRIVGYRYDPGGGINFPIFRVLVPSGDYAPPDLVGLLTADLTSNVLIEVVINGRPFSGEGFGLYSSDASPPAVNMNPFTNPLTGTNGYLGTWKLDRPHPGPDNGWGRAGFDDNGDGTNDDPGEWLWPGSDDSWSCMFPNHAMLPNNDPRVRGYAEGGGDEDYDTFDMQNMALGAVIYEGPDYAVPIHVEPSFHRTALVNFWFNWIDETWLKVPPISIPDSALPQHPSTRRLGIFLRPFGADCKPNTGDEDPFFVANPQYSYLLAQIANVRRMIMMRPLPEFNPNFTGSNDRLTSAYANLSRLDPLSGLPYLHNPLVYGPFDVDNDLDGTPDSVWIDPGLPVRAGPTGRVAKPLAAMLVVDMDGRFNLNAQGFPVSGPWAASLAPQHLAASGLATSLPYGSGYGPPEINISKLFSSNASTQTMNLLFDVGGVGRGRYGLDGVPGAAGTEAIDTLKFSEFPSNYFNSGFHVGFETPPDLWGELQMGLDVGGCPAYTTPNTGRNLLADHPYELDFSAKIASGAAAWNSRDRMYDIGELDSILRRNDFASGDVVSGAGTQGRLSQLVDAFSDMPVASVGNPQYPNQANANRTMVTTQSFDVPVPNLPRPADWPQGRRPKHISELIKERVRDRFNPPYGGMSHQMTIAWNANGMMGPPPPFDFTGLPYFDNFHDPLIAQRLLSLVSTDLVAGLRMDINRPFGNNHDDNGNGVIDEHWQNLTTAVNHFLYSESFKANNNDERINQTGAPTDPDNDGVIALDPDAFLVRQILARHLYVLMMALKPRDYHFNGINDAGMTEAQRVAAREEDAKILAQWAINAVDFRDPDSIMTPFEYDTDPFEPHPGPDGKWGVATVDDDGNGTTDDITEVLARNSDDRLWSVDGFIDDGSGTISLDDTNNPRRKLVWGCERPELLLNENIAWHDVKQEDTPVNGLLGGTGDEDNGTPPAPAGVPDLDQRYRPQGGVMLELYNPWAVRAERVPAELYTGGSLALNRISYGGGGDPVWRMLVTRTSPSALGGVHNNNPDDQPQVSNGSPNTDYQDATDVIYFTGAGPNVTNSRDMTTAKVHVTTVPIAPLPPGHHALVGTYRGSSMPVIDPNTSQADTAYVVNIGHDKDAAGALLPPSQSRRIELHADPDPALNWCFVEMNSNNSATNAGDNTETPPKRVWPEPNPPYPAIPNNYGIATVQPTVAVPILGLQVSEATAYPVNDAMGNPAVASNNDIVYTTAYDAPFDDNRAVDQHTNADDVALLQSNGVKSQYRKVHLQRLANPLLPYNKFTNPYLTIDAMPLDLHVFNGASYSGTTPDYLPTSGRDPTVLANVPTMVTRQRGPLVPGSIWNQSSSLQTASTNPVVYPSHSFVFSKDLRHSLGYLNSNLSTVRLQWDYTGMPAVTTAPDKGYVGVAGNGFVSPWLAWNNRPYVSQYEMMLVPRTNSTDLLRQFSSRIELKSTAATRYLRIIRKKTMISSSLARARLSAELPIKVHIIIL